MSAPAHFLCDHGPWGRGEYANVRADAALKQRLAYWPPHTCRTSEELRNRPAAGGCPWPAHDPGAPTCPLRTGKGLCGFLSLSPRNIPRSRMKGVRVQSLLMTPVNLRTAKCQGAQIKVTVYTDSLKVSCRCLELSDSGREETGRGPGTENVLPGLGIYVT